MSEGPRPRKTGVYRMIKRPNLTKAQMDVLRNSGKERVLSRLLVLIGNGKVAIPRAQARYALLMKDVTGTDEEKGDNREQPTAAAE